MYRPPTLLALGVAATCAAAGFFLAMPERAVEPDSETVPTVTPLSCSFVEGERAAYRFDSRVVAPQAPSQNAAARGDDSRDDANVSDADRFAGTLSWVVERGNRGRDGAARRGERARLRASLHDVTLTQELSPADQRADTEELERGVFTFEVDERCRFSDLSFDSGYRSRSADLVRSFVQSLELVLEPASLHWSAAQEDSIGTYLGRYEREGETLVRTKDSYDDDPMARQMGVQLQVFGARLEARFDPRHPDWVRSLHGRETISIEMPGRGTQTLSQQLELERDDRAFAAVAVAEGAMPDAADETVSSPIDPEIAALSLEHAQQGFLALFAEQGRMASFAAARLVADWLRAHPEQTGAWLEALRAGELDETSHAALFLGFELAGTEESRVVLGEALLDEELSEMNRARAASALADHGEPNAASAALLREQSHEGSELVANVSMLGLGSLTGRAEGPLREELEGFLHGELADAANGQDAIAAIDAMANSRDEAFADTLVSRLGGEQGLGDPATDARV